MVFAVLLLLATTTISDSEIWNEGVEYYERGDVTNALRVLRPLMLSKSHGARAAEVVAKLEYDRGNQEEASSAAQIALRAHPEDARANRNFTRATDHLLERREEARINAILKAAEGKDLGAMIETSTQEARGLMKEAGSYRTNAAKKAVMMADRLSARAEKLAEVWIPARQAITQSVTNEEQAATIMAQIESAQAKTQKAVKELADLEGEAYATMSEVEHDFTRFLKLTAMPPAAMGQDLVAQSNAWIDVAPINGRNWQNEALDFTRTFRAKFPAWARAYEQQAQADTNREPFTAEAQTKISGLATELEKLQIECCEKSLPPSQEQALEIIRQIQELLPKDKNNGGGGQNQPQGGNNDQQKQNQDQQKQDEQNQQDQQANNQEPQDDQQSEEQKEEEPSASEEQEQQPDDQEIEATLKKAQERNDEHEADKKARMRKYPLPPNERDW